MVPTLSIPFERRDRLITPRYLDESDHPWLEALLAEYERFVGRRRAELSERLGEPLPVAAARAKLRVAARVLDREYRDRTAAAVPPVHVREVLFDAAARAESREQALDLAAQTLKVDSSVLLENIFADLPGERRIAPLEGAISPTELALKANHAMVAALLRRAAKVRVRAEGNVRAVVRAAKLGGLLCTAVPDGGGRSVVLDISGPFSLFRHTLVYGRALASLLPRLARCHRFELRARCVLESPRDTAELIVRSGDPVVPAAPLAPFDSKVEERFARDFARIALDWDVIREPEGVAVGTGWIFPDFLLRHRRLEKGFLVEIVGFWTAEYLENKLAKLRAAGLQNLIVCVDEAKNCGSEALPPNAQVVRYRRRVPAGEVLRIVEGGPAR